MKRALSALFVSLLCASCAVSPDTSVDPIDVDDEVEMGTVMDSPDPSVGADACVDLDQCDVVFDGPADETDMGPAVAESQLKGPVAGTPMITRTYARMFKSPSHDSPVVGGLEPSGGVHDDLHAYGNPEGMLPPAQVVTLVTAEPQDGFYKVKFGGKVGWIRGHKLIALDSSVHPVTFALKHPNAFFKHQVRRGLWNKDGPARSGSCAPTSLAMAARILGKEPPGLSVEQSIHRIRRQYEHPIDEASDTAGTTRSEIYEAAVDLGLSVHPMTRDYESPSRALEALNEQLAKKRMVVLEGSPSNKRYDPKDPPAPTTYQKAFNDAYAAAKKAGRELKYDVYMTSGPHSILVLGRDEKGRYVVGDPMSEVGFVAISAAAMKDFMSRVDGHRGTGNAVWLKK